MPTESKHNFPSGTVIKDSTLPLQGMGSVSGWRTINKILHAAQFRQKIKSKKMRANNNVLG